MSNFSCAEPNADELKQRTYVTNIRFGTRKIRRLNYRPYSAKISNPIRIFISEIVYYESCFFFVIQLEVVLHPSLFRTGSYHCPTKTKYCKVHGQQMKGT